MDGGWILKTARKLDTDTFAYKSCMGSERQLDELDGDSLDLSVLNSESKQLQDSSNTSSCK
jgi:hypothetical protein